MTAFRYWDGTLVKAGDRVRLEDGKWNGVVEECVEGPEAAASHGIRSDCERGVFVRYDEVGLVFYPEEIEQDVVLVERLSSS